MRLALRESIPNWLPPMLEQVDGVEVRPGPTLRSISIKVNDGRLTSFEILNIPVLSQEDANEVIRRLHESNPDSARFHRLIATKHLSSATRQLLRNAGISWVEERTGTCRLLAPGLLVDVRIEATRQRNAEIPARLRGRSGLVAETLLLNFLNKEIRLASLAKQTKVSTALVSRILARLSKLELLKTHGGGPHRFWEISNPGGVLDLWASEEERTVQTTDLYVWSRAPRELLQKIFQLNKLQGRWALSGTAAANLYAPSLTTFPDPTVWIESRVPIRDVARVLGGEIADKGANVQVWQSTTNLAFVNARMWASANQLDALQLDSLPIVSPPRAYIETVNSTGRGPEAAQNLRQRILSTDVS